MFERMNLLVSLESQFHVDCATRYYRSVVVVDDKGRQHKVSMEFCQCEEESVTIIRHCMWPSSPKKPQAAYSFHFMEMMQSLMLESHVSIKSYLEAYRNMHLIQNDVEMRNLYKMAVNGSFMEYCKFVREQNSLPSVDSGNGNDWNKCWACSKRGGSVTVAVDANFGLVHKKSSGGSNPVCTEFFIHDEQVMNFLEGYNDRNISLEQACSSFKAGDHVRSKVATTKLDCTGLFGASCKHEFPLKFLSMNTGERLGYSVMVLEALVEECKPRGQKIYYLYDIACKLKSHLKKLDRQKEIQSVTFGIPVFHCYGHVGSCQIEYNPRLIDDIGLVDGEWMERLWSYLRPFSRITKETTLENRAFIPSDALTYFGRKKMLKIDETLITSLKRAQNIESLAREKFASLVSQTKGIVSAERVEEWRCQELASLQQKEVASNLREKEGDWKNTYVKDLQDLAKARDDQKSEADPRELERLTKKESLIEGKLKKMEETHKIKKRWGTTGENFIRISTMLNRRKQAEILRTAHKCAVECSWLLLLKKRYFDGQKVAKRLTRSVNNVSGRIRVAVKEYNEIAGSLNSSSIEFYEACKVDFHIYKHLDNSYQHIGAVEPAIIRQAIDTHSLYKRAVEEQKIVKEEMVSVIRHLLDLVAGLDQLKSNLKDDSDSIYSRGLHAIVCRKRVVLQQRVEGFRNVFYPYVPDLLQEPQLAVDSTTECSTIESSNEDLDSDDAVIYQIALQAYNAEEDSWDEYLDCDDDD
ncbi:uncharacterized protein LOC135683019 isoform X2 [Rhopilema esculentum]